MELPLSVSRGFPDPFRTRNFFSLGFEMASKSRHLTASQDTGQRRRGPEIQSCGQRESHRVRLKYGRRRKKIKTRERKSGKWGRDMAQLVRCVLCKFGNLTYLSKQLVNGSEPL